jgi:hypothetical protein
MDFKMLKQKQRALRDGFPETMGLRVHRAISWIGRGEAAGEDNDARFVFLWIAFNAAYADEAEFSRNPQGERSAIAGYFNRLVRLDTEKAVDKALWSRFPGPIRLLLQNRYVFGPFWQHHNGVAGFEDWKFRHEAAGRAFSLAFSKGDTVKVLSHVFDRLYILRNQIMHGGSTWNSSINREQVRDGAVILAFLLPVFVNLMMDNPHEDWGVPFYPVVE